MGSRSVLIEKISDGQTDADRAALDDNNPMILQLR
jgi:hypothetical protein